MIFLVVRFGLRCQTLRSNQHCWSIARFALAAGALQCRINVSIVADPRKRKIEIIDSAIETISFYFRGPPRSLFQTM